MKNIIDVIKGLSNLFSLKPATQSEIEKAENNLGLKLAKDYKAYIAEFGAIMADGIELSGISKSQRLNVVDMTKQEWELNPKVPHTLYVVENCAIDGIIIWQDEKGLIYQSQPNVEPKKIAKSLSEYVSSRAK